MRDILAEDAMALVNDEGIPWDSFDGRALVITGATGLIGKTLVHTLLLREKTHPSGMHITALVRNPQRALTEFGNCGSLSILSWNANDPYEGLDGIESADYIFHCANMTDSASFVQRPVDVICTTIDGARAMLDLGHETGSVVCLLSTMETYGEIRGDEPIHEDQGGFLDAMVVRNSYPEAKRLDEALSAAYASQYGVAAKVVRLTQTFGPGVAKDDNRVFAYFARCALSGEDIVMLTEGTKRNAYLYTSDAVSALLYVAAHGTVGRAYNAANDATFCAVRDMAHMVAHEFGSGSCSVRFEIDEKAAIRFRKGDMLRLDVSDLGGLGWTPRVGLAQMYERLIASWQSQ